MRSSLECIPCFMRQAVEAGRRISDDEELLGRAVRRIALNVSEFDMNLSPPEMGQKIHRILREETGCSDPYLQIKKDSTEVALSLVPYFEQLLKESENPFELSLRFAIAGNILDFALLSVWNDENIKASFEKAQQQPIDQQVVLELADELKEAKSVLILADNVGETVLDRFFIEQLPEHLDVTYAVKASPVINDATYDDAVEAGIDKLATIIDNGTDAPGTPIRQCSESFIRCFDSADVVIAKGQANFETLNTNPRKVYFLTQIKCKVIADAYDYKVGDWIVTTTTKLAEENTEAA